MANAPHLRPTASAALGTIQDILSAVICLVMAAIKIVDETHKIPEKHGNGTLRREILVDNVTSKVTRYNLAYINHSLYAGGNGRVIGCDNAHDGHHRHYFGEVEPMDFVSFEDIEERFEQYWISQRNSK